VVVAVVGVDNANSLHFADLTSPPSRPIPSPDFTHFSSISSLSITCITTLHTERK